MSAVNLPDLSPGTFLRARFTIESRLAEGGMSVLYLAKDAHLPGQWIVKQMKPLVGNREDLRQIREQFQQEATLLARLSHPGIPRVIDCFTEDGLDYLVEEYIEGETLEALLIKDGPFPESEVISVGTQLLDILTYLHDEEIIYRDMKPGNIMKDGRENIHLIDFGIARFHVSGKSADTVIVGTPGYASPEHYGIGQTDARSDIYGLGATMHFLLTGEEPSYRPFHFLPPVSLAPGTSVGLSHVIMRALSLRPEDRYPSACTMKEALRACMRSAPKKRHYEYNRSIWNEIPARPGKGNPAILKLPRHLEFLIHDDRLGWKVGDLSGSFLWDDIRQLRICRKSDADFWTRVPNAIIIDIYIISGEYVLHIPPSTPRWKELIDWIVYRAGLTLSRSVNPEGADLIYERF